MAEIVTIENGIALFTLTALEIVLGIDNIVFLTIVVGKGSIPFLVEIPIGSV